MRGTENSTHQNNLNRRSLNSKALTWHTSASCRGVTAALAHVWDDLNNVLVVSLFMSNVVIPNY